MLGDCDGWGCVDYVSLDALEGLNLESFKKQRWATVRCTVCDTVLALKTLATPPSQRSPAQADWVPHIGKRIPPNNDG